MKQQTRKYFGHKTFHSLLTNWFVKVCSLTSFFFHLKFVRIFAVLFSPGGSQVDSASVIRRWFRTLQVTGAEVCVLPPALSFGSAPALGPGAG